MAKSLSRNQRRQRAGLYFVLPAFLLYCLFFIYPFFASIYLSFTEWDGVAKPVFTGLDNYRRLVGDSLMWSSLQNNLIWVTLGTIIPVGVGLMLAVMLWTGVKGGIIFRTIIFMPMILAPVVVGVIWGWIYNPLFGVLNVGLRAIGLGAWAKGWLGDPDTALYAVLVTAIWTYIGFCVVVLFSGLQKVDTELVDAARIDGAGVFQRFRNVIVPQIKPVLTVVIVYTIIGGFNVFDVVFVMTRGGPANASELIATYMYKKSFVENEVGYGAALSVVMTVVALSAAAIALWFRRSDKGA